MLLSYAGISLQGTPLLIFLEQFTELRETLNYIYEQPDEELHRAGSVGVLSIGASVSCTFGSHPLIIGGIQEPGVSSILMLLGFYGDFLK